MTWGLYFITAWPIGLKHILASRVPQEMDQVKCVLVAVAVSQGYLTWILRSQHSHHVH